MPHPKQIGKIIERIEHNNRKRERRVEIHHGWVNFRMDLSLQVGDRCLFRRGTTDLVFEVEIFKGAEFVVISYCC